MFSVCIRFEANAKPDEKFTYKTCVVVVVRSDWCGHFNMKTRFAFATCILAHSMTKVR